MVFGGASGSCELIPLDTIGGLIYCFGPFLPPDTPPCLYAISSPRMVIIMRYLSLSGCVLVLLVSSGCQSGSYGFRNPFKDQFARTFPNSVPELMTKSKASGSDNRGVFDLGRQSSAEPGAGVQSLNDSPGASELSDRGQVSAIETILEQGDAAYAAGNLPEAAEFYREGLAVDPRNVHAHHRLAIIHDQQQDYRTAEQHYEAALKLQPENVSILNDLGYSYYLQRRFEDSKAYLEYIREIRPDNQLALRNLALVHAAEGNLQRAYALFQQGGLNTEQSRPLIQQAIARVNEGKATTRRGRMGVASTNSQPAGMSSVGGFASAKSGDAQPTSVPGSAATSSPRGDAFQPQPDLEAAYGLSANPSAGHPDSGTPTETAAPSPTASRPGHRNAHSSLAQQVRPADYDRDPDFAVERVSYAPPLQTQEPSRSDEEMIRTALNTGCGNLFPVISPDDYYRTQREFGIYPGANARNAYYEEFGRPKSRTPHVVHADSSQPATDGDTSPNSMRNVSYERPRVSSHGSARIQSPSDRSHQPGTEEHSPPANRFPVTEPTAPRYADPDYSQFPKQERPPFENSGGRADTSDHPSAGPSEMLNRPESDSPTGSGLDPTRVEESESRGDDYGPQVSPMSEQARKAHEIALERYRKMQQPQQ